MVSKKHFKAALNCELSGRNSKNLLYSFDLGGIHYNEISVKKIPVQEHCNSLGIITFQGSSKSQMTWGMGSMLKQGEIKNGNCIVTPAGFPHFSGWHNESHFSNFFIYPEFHKRINLAFHEELPHELIPGFNFEDVLLKKIFKLVSTELHTNEVADPIYIDSLLMMLGKHLSTHFKVRTTRVNKLSTLQIAQIDEYIHANLDRAIRLNELADLVNMSQFHFSRLFKAKTRMAPYRYVQSIRIEKAKNLLLTTNLPVNHIALECGFNSQAHFTSQFKKNVGVPPTKLRA